MFECSPADKCEDDLFRLPLVFILKKYCTVPNNTSNRNITFVMNLEKASVPIIHFNMVI